MERIKAFCARHSKVIVSLCFVIMVVLMVGIVASFSRIVLHIRHLERENRTLIHENQARIQDIRRANFRSCKVAFRGIKNVFTPFYPPHPTRKQKLEIAKFNHRIVRLEKRCERQFRSKPKKKRVTHAKAKARLRTAAT